MASANVCAEFRAITKKAPRDKKGEEAFVANRMHMLRTDPALNLRGRKAAVSRLAKAHKPKFFVEATPPVPGGVGYGMFFNASFKTDYQTGSAIYFEVICPNPPGGNVTTWLYLTATNRTGKGVEAFVYYKGQNNTFFKVFDWARNDHWQTNIPFANLGNYLVTRSAHGKNYQVLPIMNATQKAGSKWYNQVWLPNRVTGGLDLVYQYAYTATLSEQKNDWVGSWGPIVETFQNSYSGTKPMGALRTYLTGRDSSNRWGSWKLLRSADSYIRDDNKGFSLVFRDPNYSWAVKS
jgi:hypothetical protein